MRRRFAGHWTNLGSHPAVSFLLHKKWLDRQDSNLRMLGPKPSALPLGDGPIRDVFYHEKPPQRKRRGDVHRGQKVSPSITNVIGE